MSNLSVDIHHCSPALLSNCCQNAVTKDYGDFDTASKLDRPGVFRLNIGISKVTYAKLFDFAALARLTPYPVYGRNHFVCVPNPRRASWQPCTDLKVRCDSAVGQRFGSHANSANCAIAEHDRRSCWARS
jgi:hypothetical protein